MAERNEKTRKRGKTNQDCMADLHTFPSFRLFSFFFGHLLLLFSPRTPATFAVEPRIHPQIAPINAGSRQNMNDSG